MNDNIYSAFGDICGGLWSVVVGNVCPTPASTLGKKYLPKQYL